MLLQTVVVVSLGLVAAHQDIECATYLDCPNLNDCISLNCHDGGDYRVCAPIGDWDCPARDEGGEKQNEKGYEDGGEPKEL